MSEGKKFGELLSRVAKRVTTLQASEICCGDLTLEQFQTLRAIDAAAEPPSLGWLSAKMGVDLSTMSRNMTVLERNEYASRARSAEDGRVVTIKLTPKGRRALESLRCDEEQTFQKIYQTVPPASRPGMVRILQILDECLSAANEAPCCAPTPAARLGRARRPS